MTSTRSGPGTLTVVRLPILITLLALGTRGVTETDVWGHVRFGLDMLATRALPTFDPYSFTSTQPWVNHEWLSALLFGLAFDTGGLPLMAAVRAVSLGCALVILSKGLREPAWPMRDIVITAVILISLPLLAATRPQVFSVPLYALTLLGLRRDAIWLPLVFAAWANLHGGWMLGLGAVGIRTAFGPTLRRILVMLACLAGTLLNPYGFSLWHGLAEAVRRGWGDVLEWQPIWVLSVGREGLVIWGALAAALAWASYRRIPAAPWEWVWTACAAFVAARARRHIPFFAITLALLVFAHLRSKAAFPDRKLTWQTAGILAVPLIAASFGAFTLVGPTLRCLPSQVPPVRPEASAVRFIRDANLRGRMVMWFDWGLYAIWHAGDRIQVSYDNRRETVYSADTVRDHLYFYFGGAHDYPDRVGADYVWLPAQLPPVEALPSHGWHLLFRGPRSAIFGREERPLVTDTSPPATACFPDP